MRNVVFPDPLKPYYCVKTHSPILGTHGRSLDCHWHDRSPLSNTGIVPDVWCSAIQVTWVWLRNKVTTKALENRTNMLANIWTKFDGQYVG